MALSIKDENTDRLVRRYAGIKGLSYTKAISLAVSDALAREAAFPEDDFLARIEKMQARVSRHPRNHRSAEEILGYDANGLPE